MSFSSFAPNGITGLPSPPGGAPRAPWPPCPPKTLRAWRKLWPAYNAASSPERAASRLMAATKTRWERGRSSPSAAGKANACASGGAGIRANIYTQSTHKFKYIYRVSRGSLSPSRKSPVTRYCSATVAPLKLVPETFRKKVKSPNLSCKGARLSPWHSSSTRPLGCAAPQRPRGVTTRPSPRGLGHEMVHG